MKILLLLVLVLGSAHSHGSHEECLQKINGFRAEWANKYNVSNMNELEYDEKIETVIREEMAKMEDCSQQFVKHDVNMKIYVNVPREKEQMEVSSPAGDTMVACVKSECNGKEIFSLGLDKGSMKTDDIRGPAGTKCPSDRVATTQGLCARPKGNQKFGMSWKYEGRRG
ncbi:hypothetical protein CAEBREN_24132 [Caenorhabditis brenneri]|uniref:Uncharacterized protein n=1 Tax=Caenorhabditis brenneri TaxID=135651 RepID=G0MMT8_CAEBE|nr:hypothetical protein CAEBREN_24132 [Caenorhabditis brenneri]